MLHPILGITPPTFMIYRERIRPIVTITMDDRLDDQLGATVSSMFSKISLNSEVEIQQSDVLKSVLQYIKFREPSLHAQLLDDNTKLSNCQSIAYTEVFNKIPGFLNQLKRTLVQEDLQEKWFGTSKVFIIDRFCMESPMKGQITSSAFLKNSTEIPSTSNDTVSLTFHVAIPEFGSDVAKSFKKRLISTVITSNIQGSATGTSECSTSNHLALPQATNISQQPFAKIPKILAITQRSYNEEPSRSSNCWLDATPPRKCSTPSALYTKQETLEMNRTQLAPKKALLKRVFEEATVSAVAPKKRILDTYSAVSTFPENPMLKKIVSRASCHAKEAEKSQKNSTVECSTRSGIQGFSPTSIIVDKSTNFAYIAIATKNSRVLKFSLATFSHHITEIHCEFDWKKRLTFYTQKLQLKTIFIAKSSTVNINMKQVEIKLFSLGKDKDLCAICHRDRCTAGRLNNYFKKFHKLNYTDCDYLQHKET